MRFPSMLPWGSIVGFVFEDSQAKGQSTNAVASELQAPLKGFGKSVSAGKYWGSVLPYYPSTQAGAMNARTASGDTRDGDDRGPLP